MNSHLVISFQEKFLHSVYLTIAICTLLLAPSVFAAEYQLKLIVDLSEIKDVSTEALWLEPLTSPNRDNSFFVAQDSGILYWVDGDALNNQKKILDLASSLENQKFVSLNAFALHPSFTKPDKPGYATFFTAHTGTFNSETRRNLLQPKAKNFAFEFTFETVITAWQYDFEKQEIDPQSQREIIRIPIKNKDGAIQKLAFDPFQKEWNPDYGQLYFSLNYLDELQQHPLYSGAILRIHPLMFGARNYTVSGANPFVKKPKINNEIVLLNGQNIDDFYWTKNEHASIFIQHNNAEQHWLSKTKLGDDLLNQAPTNSLWQQAKPMSSMLLYQGRSILSLRNSVVYFTLIDGQWHLTSRSLELIGGESSVFDGLIETQDLSTDAGLSIHQDQQGEIILFDHQNSRMYSLLLVYSGQEETEAPTTVIATPGPTHNWLYIVILVAVLVLLILLYRKNAEKRPHGHLLSREYVRYRFEPTTQNILLYKSIKKDEHYSLPLKDITGCDILLNDNVICTIDDKQGNALSNQIEKDIRAIFIEEYSDTLHDEITRHIEIVLYNKEEHFPVSVYLRKGNNRVIGSKYFEIVDILFDLCWNISKHLNPKETESRVAPRTAVPGQSFAARTKKLARAKANNEASERHSVTNNDGKDSKVAENAEVMTDGQAIVQTGVVDSLDKLVNLHQQGYLNDEEFKAAKTKLLQSLIGS